MTNQYARPEPEFRWVIRNGEKILQQKFLVERHDWSKSLGQVTVGFIKEWRDIPVEIETEGSASG